MTKRILPTPEELRQLLRYEPETGKLYWKSRPADMFRETRHCNVWNARYANKEAFTCESHGYRAGRIYDVMMKAHRVAWAIHVGAWPVDCIDHVNGDRSDNRIANLREATKAQNSMNQAGGRGGKSKLKGISWFSARNKWKAEIRYNGKRKFLGHFDCEKDAYAAYCKASSELHGEFSRTE